MTRSLCHSGEWAVFAALRRTSSRNSVSLRAAAIRRGIRLERFFWISLKRLAESRKSTLGQGRRRNCRNSCRGRQSDVRYPRGLHSLASDKNADLQKLASLKTINAILVACPSPAFALSSSKKILDLQPAVPANGQASIAWQVHGDDARQDLKLALDLNVADIFSRLDANGENPVVTGFVIGAGDRRYRGQLNVVRAPLIEPELLMAFVFNG